MKVSIGSVDNLAMRDMRAALGSGLGLYWIAVVVGLGLAVAIGEILPGLVTYGPATAAALVALVIPQTWRSWPLVIAALPAIPLSFLYALFLFPLYLPITALLLVGALRTFRSPAMAN